MDDPLIGAVLRGRYRVERKLGSGGMGSVYAAVHLELARPVAVKTLLEVQGEEDLARFRTEALAAASLAHPHIVTVSDFVPAKGDEPAFLVMELLAGRGLNRMIAERGALPERTAVHVALQMLDALEAAHRAKILHRDVKPANVIVLDGTTPDAPWVKLVDFSIAKLMNDESRHTTTGTLLGTPPYMAPEQFLAEKPSVAVDLWAVGVCLFEMLAGARPFGGKGGELVAAITRGIAATLPATIRPSLAAVVARALRRDPRERWASASEMADALRRATATTPAEPRRWPVFVATAIATLAIGALLFAAVRPRERARELLADAAPPVLQASTSPPEAPPIAPIDAATTEEIVDAASRGPALTPSVCREGVFALCPFKGHRCQCWSDTGVVCPTAWTRVPMLGNKSVDACTTHDIYSATARSGDACKGFVQVWNGEGPDWTVKESAGTLTCWDECLDSFATKHPTLAVPGTACKGWYGQQLHAGTWSAASR